MKGIILGAGEVGRALYEVLAPFHPTLLYDLDPPGEPGVEILHICFPYGAAFVSEVEAYRRQYRPRLIVVHSTVPVGTCETLRATHSPIRGNHADMARSLRAFVKFVGGQDADEVAEYFNRAGIRPAICRSSRTTELGKLLCTTFYGVIIEYTKSVEKKCEAEGVPFAEAWTLFQQTYNEGYTAIGRPDYQRPILTPMQRRIGGHCVLPNLDLLGDFGPGLEVKERNKS